MAKKAFESASQKFVRVVLDTLTRKEISNVGVAFYNTINYSFHVLTPTPPKPEPTYQIHPEQTLTCHLKSPIPCRNDQTTLPQFQYDHFIIFLRKDLFLSYIDLVQANQLVMSFHQSLLPLEVVDFYWLLSYSIKLRIEFL